MSVLVSNGYPLSFLQSIPRPENGTPAQSPRPSLKPPRFTLRPSIPRCLQQQGVRAVFKSETTLRSHLVTAKRPCLPD